MSRCATSAAFATSAWHAARSPAAPAATSGPHTALNWCAYWETGGRRHARMHKRYIGRASATATPDELRAIFEQRQRNRAEAAERKRRRDTRSDASGSRSGSGDGSANSGSTGSSGAGGSTAGAGPGSAAAARAAMTETAAAAVTAATETRAIHFLDGGHLRLRRTSRRLDQGAG